MTTSVRVTYQILIDVGQVADDAVEAALQDVVDVALEDANRTIPLEEGIMQDSGFTQVSGKEGQVAYADVAGKLLKQHEDSSLRHDAGRRDHWLEQSVEENKETYAEYIASKVRARLS